MKNIIVLTFLSLFLNGCWAGAQQGFDSKTTTTKGGVTHGSAQVSHEKRPKAEIASSSVTRNSVEVVVNEVQYCRTVSDFERDVTVTEDKSLSKNGKKAQMWNGILAGTAVLTGAIMMGMAAECTHEDGSPCTAQEEQNIKTGGIVAMTSTAIPVGFFIANAARTGKSEEKSTVHEQKMTGWSECGRAVMPTTSVIASVSGVSLGSFITDSTGSVSVPFNEWPQSAKLRPTIDINVGGFTYQVNVTGTMAYAAAEEKSRKIKACFAGIPKLCSSLQNQAWAKCIGDFKRAGHGNDVAYTLCNSAKKQSDLDSCIVKGNDICIRNNSK